MNSSPEKTSLVSIELRQQIKKYCIVGIAVIFAVLIIIGLNQFQSTHLPKNMEEGGILLQTSTIIQMNDTTSSYGLSTNSGRPIQAEYVSSTSSLVGKSIDTIVVKLQKVGIPSGTVKVGVFNSDGSVKQLFDSISTTSIGASSYAQYSFSLPTPKAYQIKSGDRIGIKFTDGNASNFVSIMTDKANSFDGTNSYLTYYTTSWQSFTGSDLYMILEGHVYPTATGKNFSILTTIFGNNISDQISQLKPYFNSADVVDLQSNQISYASELKSKLGVHVAIAGQTTINLQQLKSQAPTWSLGNVDVIAYDFEPGTVPDFSTDQSTAISKFSQAYQIAHSLNKKLWINPTWQGGWQSDGKQWDWGEVAKNTDILCLQIPNLETGARQFGKNTHGMTLEQVVSSVVQQVKSKAPNTKLYFQFGAGTGQTPQQAIDDINKIKSLGIDGVFIFPQSGKTDFLVTVMQGIGKTS